MVEEVYRFFTFITELGLDQLDSLNYWPREGQYYSPFYSDVMVHNRVFHLPSFIHFENNDYSPNHGDPDYDRFWKIRKIFDTLNNKFCEMYNLTEHLAVSEVIILYRKSDFLAVYPKETQKI
jgi:hypothetical protein